MIDAAVFAEGLSRLGLATRADVTEPTLNVYHDALGTQTTAEEWRSFTLTAVGSGRFRFFPTVAELLDALAEFRGERTPEGEAVEAYERVLNAGTYTPEGGTSWTFRAVCESCGRAAAEAFLSAGGHGAFATTWDEAKRRERFVREYVAVARLAPETRLLPATPRPALASGDERSDPPRDEARGLLRRIQERAQA